jgi:Ca2+ transporting ATPase
MSVAAVVVVASRAGALSSYDVTGTSYAPEGRVLDARGAPLAAPADRPALEAAAACAALCNDSHLGYDAAAARYRPVGEATEVALRVLAEKIGLPGYAAMPAALARLPPAERAAYCNEHWARAHRRVAELEFSRDRKAMSVLCAEGGAAGGGGPQRLRLFVKGAPEAVLARCASALADDGSGEAPLAPETRAALAAAAAALGAGRALRVLALASRPWAEPGRLEVAPADERGLRFEALVGMHDPPRPEVADAIAACRAAGIRVVMVTGDNAATAEAVGAAVGLVAGGGGPLRPPAGLTGAAFDALDAAGQAEAAAELAVFSRVEPSHKARLVELLQAGGHVVAVTGDGVNDAPALRRADIGVAMGSGTAVARAAADVVLADDNFATIVAAVAAGRSIYANTRQVGLFVISLSPFYSFITRHSSLSSPPLRASLTHVHPPTTHHPPPAVHPLHGLL